MRNWNDVIQHSEKIPPSWRRLAVDECRRCQLALEADDIAYLVSKFAPSDRWRILAHYLEQTSYFDIETAGLEYDDPVTVIVCWHKGDLKSFVEHENLDDFLLLLEDVKLLTSFNGASFDVPRVLDAFHIPDLPCPHLDLRWLCYHQGLRGGLKEITHRAGIHRPTDLQQADGELAIRLWARWQHFNDVSSREELIRYCASDVLLLVELARKLVGCGGFDRDELWTQLPPLTMHAELEAVAQPPAPLEAFGPASPTRMRARRRDVG